MSLGIRLTPVDVCVTLLDSVPILLNCHDTQVSRAGLRPELYRGLEVFQDITDQTRRLHIHIHGPARESPGCELEERLVPLRMVAAITHHIHQLAR